MESLTVRLHFHLFYLLMRKRGLIAHCVCVGEPTTKGEKNDKKMDRHIKKRKKLDIKKRKTGTGAAGEGPQHAAAM